MNRKKRKKRKMELRRLGMEVYYPNKNAVITTSALNFPSKIARKFIGNQIFVGQMIGYEFTRLIPGKRQ